MPSVSMLCPHSGLLQSLILLNVLTTVDVPRQSQRLTPEFSRLLSLTSSQYSSYAQGNDLKLWLKLCLVQSGLNFRNGFAVVETV